MKMTKRIVAVFLTVLMALSTLSLSMTASAAKKISKISLSKTSTTMYTTRTLTLKAKVKPSSSKKKVKWTTSDKSIATVSSKGVVKAKKAGKVTITAKATDGSGKKATCKITVKKLVKIKSMEMSNIKVKTGDSKQLKVTVTPSKASIKKYKWSSADESIATVDSSGNVTGISAGKTTITAKAKDGSGKSTKCTVTVTPVQVSSVTLNKTALSIVSGQSAVLTAGVKPSNAANKAVAWSSSDAKIATVDASGKVTGVGVGTATITAKAKDGSGKSATCTVTVGPALVTAITLSKTSVSVSHGSSTQLTATVSPANATNKKVTWSSSNTAIATVDASGKVTGVGVGTADITATANDGSGKKAVCKVTVTAVAVSSIAVDKTSAEVCKGGKITLTATVSPSYASNKTLKWTSSDTTVATVDQSGVVRGVDAGTAVIEAAAMDGSGKKVSCTVTVWELSIMSSVGTDSSWYVGKTGKLTAVVYPTTVTGKEVTWSSSDSSYAAVDANGNVTVKNYSTILSFKNNVTITATAKDGSGAKATYEVKISKFVQVTSIAFDEKATSELFIGETDSLKAVVSPSDASEKGAIYKSSDETVVTVDAYGTVRGVGEGTATVTATAKDGSGKTVSKVITVKPAALKDVKIISKKDYYKVGDLATFYCKTDPDTAGQKLGVHLESEDESIAVFNRYNASSSVYFTLKFVGIGKTRVRVVVGEGENALVSDWIDVEVRELRSDSEYFENVKEGEVYPVSVYFYNGEALTKEIGGIGYEDNEYFDINYNSETGKFDITVEKELPDEGACVVFKDTEARFNQKIWFVKGSYTLPAEEVSSVKKYSEKARNVIEADVEKTVAYSNVVVDNNKSSSKMKVNGMDLTRFIRWAEIFLGGSGSGSDGDADDLLAEIAPDKFIKELFADSDKDSYQYDPNDEERYLYPAPITVNESDVSKVEVINKDSDSTYQIKLTLKDQANRIALEAVASSAYGKTMKVIDKKFMEDYKSTLSEAEDNGSEKLTTNLDYGTITQKYAKGYVLYTIDKVTDNVIESEYHYNTDMKVDKADFVMSAEMEIDILGKITMDTEIIGYFTMNVDSTTKYTNMKY